MIITAISYLLRDDAKRKIVPTFQPNRVPNRVQIQRDVVKASNGLTKLQEINNLNKGIIMTELNELELEAICGGKETTGRCLAKCAADCLAKCGTDQNCLEGCGVSCAIKCATTPERAQNAINKARRR